MKIIKGKRDEYGVPIEPDEKIIDPYIVTFDWEGNEIWNEDEKDLSFNVKVLDAAAKRLEARIS